MLRLFFCSLSLVIIFLFEEAFFDLTLHGSAVFTSIFFTLLLSIHILSLKIYHPLTLFLGTSLLFLFNRVYLHAFGVTKIVIPNFMGTKALSDPTAQEAMFVLMLGVVFFTIGGCCSEWVKTSKLKSNTSLYKFGWILFLVGLLPAFYSQAMVTLKSIKLGYLGLFKHGGISYVPSLANKIIGVNFRLGFYFMLFSKPQMFKTLKYLTVFIIFLLIGAMSGIRGYYFASFIVVFWYLCEAYLKKVSLLKVFLLSVLLIGSAGVLAQFRLGLKVGSLKETVLGTVYKQGTSILTLMYSVDFKEQKRYEKKYHGKYSEINTQIQNDVDFFVSPLKKKRGFSLGTSIFQFSYVFYEGRFGVAFWLFIIGFLLNLAYRLAFCNPVTFVFFMAAFPYILFSPRGNIFLFTSTYKIVILSLIAYLIYLYLKKFQLKKLII